jgi:hypothetical protein
MARQSCITRGATSGFERIPMMSSRGSNSEALANGLAEASQPSYTVIIAGLRGRYSSEYLGLQSIRPCSSLSTILIGGVVTTIGFLFGTFSKIRSLSLWCKIA